jgi:hypothetical protein
MRGCQRHGPVYVAGIVAGAPARSLISQWLRRGITAVFMCLACYFLLWVRLILLGSAEGECRESDSLFIRQGIEAIRPVPVEIHF